MSELPERRRPGNGNGNAADALANGHGRPAVVPAHATEQEINYGELLNLLWRRKWALVLIVVLCLGVSFVYLKRTPKQYSSYSRICLQPSSHGLVGGEDVPAQPANYLAIQSELIRSPAILTDAIEHAPPGQLRSLRSSNNPATVLRNGLKVDSDKTDDSISISYTAPSADEAAAAVNAVVDSYSRYQNEKAGSAISEVVRILKLDEAELQKERADELQAEIDFQTKNPSLSYGKAGDNIIVQKLAALSNAVTAADLQNRLMDANLKSAKALPRTADELATLLGTDDRGAKITSTPLLAVEGRIASARATIDQQRAILDRYNPVTESENPSVKAAQATIQRRMSELPGLEQQRAACLLDLIQVRADAAALKFEELTKDYEKQQQLAFGLNKAAAEYNALDKQLAQTTSMADSINAKIAGINAARDLSGFVVSVLEPATAADAASEPQKTRVVGIALAIGLVLGFATVLLLDWADQRLWGVREVRGLFGTPVLGIVPRIRRRRQISSIGRIVEFEPMSPFSEAFRTLRTGVFFGMGHHEHSKRLLVTSAEPGDGKSVTAANLAISMGQAGSRTLLVDADLRSPAQHEIFGMPNDQGLTSVLDGTIDARHAIRTTSVPGLDILTAGPSLPNPAELLNSQRLEDVLAELGQHYDHIVFDSPPVKLVTDPCILAAMCDATLLVFRASRSRKRDAASTIEALHSLGVHVLGGVLNDMPVVANRYAYRYPSFKSGRNKRLDAADADADAGRRSQPGKAVVVARRHR
jgi:capsular exopolysaccharide synthesis family protein